MSASHAPPRLLLVDDNRDNLALMRLFLENGDYEIDEAANGQEAVTRFAARDYDLVFMDLEMPVLDGYGATRAIRDLERQRQTAPVPVLALTAHALDEHRRRCQEAGFTDFLVKPVRKAAILDTLLRFLRQGGYGETPAGAPPPGDFPDMLRLRPLLPLFFDTSRATLETARQALSQGAMEDVRRQGHKLKGAANSYGFRDLGRAALALEQAGEAGDGVAAGTAVQWASALLSKARLDWGL